MNLQVFHCDISGRIAGPRGAAGLEIDEDLHGGQDPGTDLGREELRQGWDLHHAVTGKNLCFILKERVLKCKDHHLN